MPMLAEPLEPIDCLGKVAWQRFWRFHGSTSDSRPLKLIWAQHLQAPGNGSGIVSAECRLAVEEGHCHARTTPSALQAQASQGVRRLLGVDQPVEAAWAKLAEQGCLTHVPDPDLEALRLWPVLTPFEAGVRAILSQQISIKAARAIRARLLAAMPQRDGYQVLHPQTLRQMPESAYRACGLSATKARAMQALAESDLLPCDWLPDALNAAEAQSLTENLIRLPGIGPWTAQYALVRGFGYADADLSGDQGVRVGLQRWQSLQSQKPAELPSIASARQWLAAMQPYRTQAAAFLWWLAAEAQQ
ncbi:DNA-3-methyladenine glycosylase [Thiomicrospira sp. WB1]|uniref:DNA-3-methyladenine glycosylase family protein n=1 Tax=Thiomicrospira sp. WB1 TaxID=1685380 RepID=UPI000749F1AD|nr:DNA-3-methyladenine glycosylase [Thiomicrospira sp. WB1]KUJ72322.1 hypothetical protein AVO41_00450 [Thiomicrospira sp. WB1]